MDEAHYDADEVIARYQEVLRRDPADEVAHFAIGQAWYQKASRSRRQSEWLQARASLEVAVAAFPERSGVWIKLSQAYWALGDRAAALYAAQEAVARDRLNSRCYNNLARIQRRMGQWRSCWQTWRTWFAIEYRRARYDNGENGTAPPAEKTGA